MIQIDAIEKYVFYLVAGYLVIYGIYPTSISIYLDAEVTAINGVVLDLGVAGIVAGRGYSSASHNAIELGSCVVGWQVKGVVGNGIVICRINKLSAPANAGGW